MDVVLMSVGLKARLEVDAFHDKKFNGVVTDVANSSKNSSPLNGSGGSSQQDATRFEVRIRVQDKEAFRPGMSVTAEIETRYRTNVLAVPIQSVTTRLPGNGLNGSTNFSAVTPKPESPAGDTPPAGSGAEKKKEGTKPVEVVFTFDGKTVKAVPVKRGISDDTYVEIVDGLQESQEVISGGYRAISRDLKDGAMVKLSSSNSPPAGVSPPK
jgi:HlyD family secretion protein